MTNEQADTQGEQDERAEQDPTASDQGDGGGGETAPNPTITNDQDADDDADEADAPTDSIADDVDTAVSEFSVEESADDTDLFDESMSDEDAEYFAATLQHRACMAGFPMHDARFDPTQGSPELWPKDFDFRTQPDSSLPRNVRAKRYAELEHMITQMQFPGAKPGVVARQNYTDDAYVLPRSHQLSPASLQDLLVALIDAQENGDEPPDWEDFTD